MNQSCCSTSDSNCCFLTCLQDFQKAGKVVWYSHLLNFPLFVVIYTVRGFSIVNEAEADTFGGEFSCFSMIQQMLTIWSLLLLPFLNPIWIFGSSQFMYCWTLAWRILSMWSECSYTVIWTFSDIIFLWVCYQNWPFYFFSPVATAEFSKFAGILSAALLGFEIAQLEFHHLH